MNSVGLVLVVFLICISSAENRIKRQIHYPDEDTCTTPNRQRGVCIPLTECVELRSTRNFAYLRRSICGYDRDVPRVCCPQSTVRPSPAPVTPTPTRPRPPTPTRPRPPTPTRSRTPTPTPTRPRVRTPPTRPVRPDISPNRNIPSILPTNCGITNHTGSRIVGGRKSALAAWPWMAAVYLTRSGLSRGTDCGGALITNRHVITAAHCTIDTRRGTPMSASMFTVRLGEHILNDDNDGANPRDFPVESIVRHEDFQRRTFKNDIAIMTLRDTVQFNPHIQPICLPYDREFNEDDLSGRNAFVAGWGTTAFDGEFSAHISEIQIRVWENGKCREAFARDVQITEEYLCAGVSDGTKDSCQGDSGGPLMLPGNNTRFSLVGIVSFGKRCATPNFPGVYTRVTKYLEWIGTHLS